MTADEAEEARACQRLWAAVVMLQLIDARLPDRYAAARDQARDWLRQPTPGRDAILDAAGLDPRAFDSAMPRLVEEWAKVDSGEVRRRMPAMGRAA